MLLVTNTLFAQEVSETDIDTEVAQLEEKYDVDIDIDTNVNEMSTSSNSPKAFTNLEELEIVLESLEEIRSNDEPAIFYLDEHISDGDFSILSGSAHGTRQVSYEIDAPALEVSIPIPVDVTWDIRYDWATSTNTSGMGYRFTGFNEINTFSTGIDVISWEPSSHSFSYSSSGGDPQGAANLTAVGAWRVEGDLGAYGSSVNVGISASDTLNALVYPNPPTD